MLKYVLLLEKYQRDNKYIDLSCFREESHRSQRLYQIRLSSETLTLISNFFTNVNKKNKMLKIPILPLKILSMPNEDHNMINLIVPINQKFKDFFKINIENTHSYFYKFIYFHKKNELKDPLTFQFIRPM